jgi:hypothetical protein
MRQSRSPAGVEYKAVTYAPFLGLDTMRDVASMDTGKSQALTTLTNGFVDSSGQIVREPPAAHVEGALPCRFVRFMDQDLFAYSQETDAGVNLTSNRGHLLEAAYLPGSPLSGSLFSDKLYVASFGQALRTYDGGIWRESERKAIRENPPAMVCVVNRRLAVAGMERHRSQIWLSRVDQADTMPADEDPNDENVLRAGFIDIANMTDGREIVTGIHSFEWNRLAVFTGSRALVYVIDPDIDKWSIADQTVVNVGCVSNNTIVNAGNQLLFCSKSGVHAMSRSQYNNVSVNAVGMSRSVEILYRSLLSQVGNLASISAVWDADTGRYHVFFPVAPTKAYRMTLVLPVAQDDPPRWALGAYLSAACADALDGAMLLGTPSGIYRPFEIGQPISGSPPPVDLDIRTPILWCGSTSDIKESYSYLLHMTGQGTVKVSATDEEGIPIMEDIIDLDGAAQPLRFPMEPLSRQFERKFERRFRGVRFRFQTSGTSLVRLSAFAINVRK